MEQFEMVVHSAEHITLLTKVLMMFSRRRVDVISVVSETNRNAILYVINFKSGKDEAYKLQKQIEKATDILSTNLVQVEFIKAKYSNKYQDYQPVTR